MLKTIAAGIAMSFAIIGAALAQTCPAYPYTLANGATADANQVMANFNGILNCANSTLAPLASPQFTGHVGIGMSGGYPLLVNNGRASAGDGTGVYIKGYQPSLQFMNYAGTLNWFAGVNDATNNEFVIGPGYGPNQGLVQSFRINQYSQVGVGGTAPGGWSGNAVLSAYTSGGGWAGSFYQAAPSGSGVLLVRTDSTANLPVAFYFSSYLVGSIATNGSSVAYNTTSDYRLKTNVAPLSHALARLMLLQPKIYNWKTDPGGQKAEGFLAHEVQDVLPYAVTGDKDAMNSDGSIKPQQVDYSKLVPLLVAAAQEQQAEIAQLRSEVATLKVRR